ncbi:MAG: epoxyqueuosine reductase QueH [Armatimonadota bacterium]
MPARAPQQDGVAGPTVALHVCCGPCATAVIERLRASHDVRAVWYNPNVHPGDEHQRRLEAMQRVAELSDVPLAVLEYDPCVWYRVCEGLMAEPEGRSRCDVCFRLRLERVAQWAAEQGVGAIATTLTVSPYKPAGRINPIGTDVARAHGLAFVAEDFGKRAGFARSVELSRQWGLFRQSWCGCAPSRRRGAR